MNHEKKIAFSVLRTILKELMKFKTEEEQRVFYTNVITEINNATLHSVNDYSQYQDFQELYETCLNALNDKDDENKKAQDEHRRIEKELQDALNGKQTELYQMLDDRQRLESEFHKTLNDKISNERQRLENELQLPINEKMEHEKQQLRSELQAAYNVVLENEKKKLQIEFEKVLFDQIMNERKRLETEIHKNLTEQMQVELQNIQTTFDAERNQMKEESQQLQAKLTKALQTINQKQDGHLSNESVVELKLPTFKYIINKGDPKSLREIIASIDTAFNFNYITQHITTRASNLENIVSYLKHIIDDNEQIDHTIKTQVNDIIKSNEIAPLAFKLMESFRHQDEFINIYRAAFTNMLEYYTQLTNNETPKSTEKNEMWDKDLTRLFGEVSVLTRRTRNLYDKVEIVIKQLENTDNVDAINLRETYKEFLEKSMEHKMTISSIEHQLNQLHDRCIQRAAVNNKQYVEIKTLRAQITILNRKRQRLIKDRNDKVTNGDPINKLVDSLIKYTEAIENDNVQLQTQLQIMGEELKRHHIDLKDKFDEEVYNMIFPEPPKNSMALKDELTMALRRYNGQIKKLNPSQKLTDHVNSIITNKKPTERAKKSKITNREALPTSSNLDIEESFSENVDMDSDIVKQNKRKDQEDDIPPLAQLRPINTAKKSKPTDSNIPPIQ